MLPMTSRKLPDRPDLTQKNMVMSTVGPETKNGFVGESQHKFI
jgi:hypothetical protein